MKQAIFVYPGLGKTTLARQNDKFADIESKLFKDLTLKEYIGQNNYEYNTRGVSVKKINPEFPENILKYMREKLNQGKTLLLVPKQDNYDLIESLDLQDFLFVMPSIDRLKLLESDYKKRGDDKDYIKRNITDRYFSVINDAKNMGKEIFLLNSGEYLKDIINKL